MIRTTLRVCVAAVVLTLGLTTLAWASHYRLPASGLVSRSEHKVLSKAGITDTRALFERAATKQGRRELSKSTRIAAKRLYEIAQSCDLLRVKGVGPTMVRLLQATGVHTLAVLAKQAAGSLRAKMVAANQSSRISEVVPEAASLGNWIGQARRLPKKLQ